MIRLPRDEWARQRREFRFSNHVDVDPIVERTNQDPAANATKAEIKTLIAALEEYYAGLGVKLKALMREHPLAQMPGESEIKYRKRVPESKTFSAEQRLLLVWLAHNRTNVGRWIKVFQKSQQPHGHGSFQHINRDETVQALLQPFEERWTKVYFAALHAEEARVRAIIEATPIDDAAWEAYQVKCDWSDAHKEAEAALEAERKARGFAHYSAIYGDNWHDILRERADARAPEITAARHARERTNSAA